MAYPPVRTSSWLGMAWHASMLFTCMWHATDLTTRAAAASLRENQPGAVVVTANESSTREEKLRAWAGEMGSQRAEARNLRMQLVQVRPARLL